MSINIHLKCKISTVQFLYNNRSFLKFGVQFDTRPIMVTYRQAFEDIFDVNSSYKKVKVNDRQSKWFIFWETTDLSNLGVNRLTCLRHNSQAQ